MSVTNSFLSIIPLLIDGSDDSAAPSTHPTQMGTDHIHDSAAPTFKPTEAPTSKPTEVPTSKPTDAPTFKPTAQPNVNATPQPSGKPTQKPTMTPTSKPSMQPSMQPTGGGDEHTGTCYLHTTTVELHHEDAQSHLAERSRAKGGAAASAAEKAEAKTIVPIKELRIGDRIRTISRSAQGLGVDKEHTFTKVVALPHGPTTQPVYSIKMSTDPNVVVDATQYHTFVRCGMKENRGELLAAAKDIKQGDCLLTHHGKKLVRSVSLLPEDVSKASETYSIVTEGGDEELIAVGGVAAHPTKTKATKAKAEPWAEQINKEAALDATKEKAAKAKATAAAGAKQKAAIKTIHKMTQMVHENDRKTHIRGGRKYLR